MQGLGVHLQLDLFRGLSEALLPDIYNVLCQHDLVQMFFAYRWVVLAFKREFNLEQVSDRFAWLLQGLVWAVGCFLK